MPLKTVMVLLNDLMFQVKIETAAKAAGIAAVFIKSEAVLFERAKERPAAIILDLNLLDLNLRAAGQLSPDGDATSFIKRLKADAETRSIPLIGYVSHVQVEARAAAELAGCDTVYARSAFVQKLPELLQSIGVAEELNNKPL